MRTTITLEPDVEILVRAAMKELGISFDDAVNEGLRKGLPSLSTVRGAFRQRTVAMGGNPSVARHKALAIATAMEDEEVRRKLAVEK